MTSYKIAMIRGMLPIFVAPLVCLGEQQWNPLAVWQRKVSQKMH